MTHTEQCYMMAWLARMIDARVIVEAGTYLGKAAKVFAEVNPEATVYTADPFHEAHSFPQNVIYRRGDFLEMLEGLPVVDFAYIDATPPDEHGTRHTYRYRYRSGLACAEKLSPDGIICFDDTNPAPWREPFPELADIQAMCQINLRACKGLSIYQKEDEQDG